MHIKKALPGLMAILLPLFSLSQHKTYTVADTVSPALFTHIKALAGSATAKLYIISCFSHTCSSSVQCLRSNTQLQQQFGNAVAFINVTNEATPAVKTALAKKGAQYNNIPYTAADSLITKAFPHTLLPHIIWLSGTGVVRAITAPQHLTANNISNILAHPSFTLPVKQDIAFDPSIPLLHNLGLQQPALTYTWFSNEIAGLPSTQSRKKINETQTLLRATNTSVAGLYALAFKKWLLQPNQFIIDTAITNQSFCYESLLNTTVDSLVTTIVLGQLNNCFGTTASIQKQQLTWYVLQADSSASTTMGITADEFLNSLHTYNLPWIQNMVSSKYRIPEAVLDTLASAPLSLWRTCPDASGGAGGEVSYINQLIQPYGFHLTTTTTLKEVLVITKKQSH